MFTFTARGLPTLLVLLCLTAAASAQQVPDPNFDATVARPAYTRRHPKALFDEAHNNFHKSGWRYKPFAQLIANDGYEVVAGTEKFSKESLKGFAVLIISNALGPPPDATAPAFTEEECDAVRDWVRAGGSLLFIADHYPMGAAAEGLSKRFGVDMSKGYTDDPANQDKELKNLLFSRDNRLLEEHPVTRGRNRAERVNRVVTFTGQSLKGPAGSVAFMKLADTAFDLLPPDRRKASAAGRAQGVALKFGKGRVVVLGEAAMLTAQLGGPNQVPFGGLNSKGIDNKKLALNIMHWLTGLLR